MSIPRQPIASTRGSKLRDTVSITNSGSFKFTKSNRSSTSSGAGSSGAGSSDAGAGSALRLPISASDVLEARYTGKAALRDEMLHGNPVLMRTLEALGMVGTRPLGSDRAWEIAKMYLAPSVRGSGLAQRLIDTAEMHGEGGAEEVAGQALADALRTGVPRSELFIISKA